MTIRRPGARRMGRRIHSTAAPRRALLDGAGSAGTRLVGPVSTDARAEQASPTPGSGPTLARIGARGAIWQGLAQSASKIIIMVTTVALARLLTPQEYGLVGLALVLLAYTETVADAGVTQALVFLQRSPEVARAALLLCLLSGLLFAGLLVGAGPLIGPLFGLGDVTPLVQALALSTLALAAGAVPDALLRRNLRFGRMTVVSLTKATLSGAVTLALLFSGQGVWSLVFGTVAGSLCYAVMSWILVREPVPWQLWRVRRAELRSTLRFGAPVAGGTLLSRLIFDVDYLIVAAILGAQALGYYTLAFRLPELVIINVFFVLSTVLFPVYSQARDDPDRLRRGYLLSTKVQSLFGFSAGVGLACVAAGVVPLMFGPQWQPAVVPLMLLSLYAAARSLGVGANEVYKAVGRPGLTVAVALTRLAILVPILVLATRWGIVGVATAQLVVALLFSVGMQLVAAKVMKLRRTDILRATVPAVQCAIALALIGLLFHGVTLAPVVGTAATVLSGIAVVMAVLWLRHQRFLVDLVRLGFR